MFNDLSSPAALLATRRSGKPRDMVAPGPDAAQLRRILEAATRVPDHGKLAPWRFLTVAEEARGEFAALLRRALLAADPAARPTEIAAADQFAHQAAGLVIAIFSPVVPSKIPLWEQQLSMGAACMTLLTATHAEGFVGGWLSGWPTYAPIVAEGLGLRDQEKIAGFFFLGTPARPQEERPRPAYDDVVQPWPPRG